MHYLKRFKESFNVEQDSKSDDNIIYNINSLLIDLTDEGFHIKTYFTTAGLEIIIAKSDFIRQKRSIGGLNNEIYDIITNGDDFFTLDEVFDRIEMLNDFLSSDFTFSKYVFQTDEYMDMVTAKHLPDDEGLYDFIILKYKKK